MAARPAVDRQACDASRIGETSHDGLPRDARRRPRGGARAHAGAGRALGRPRHGAGDEPAHEPAGVGPRAHRRLRGPVARAPASPACRSCTPSWRPCTTPSRRRGRRAAACRCSTARRPSSTWPTCAAAETRSTGARARSRWRRRDGDGDGRSSSSATSTNTARRCSRPSSSATSTAPGTPRARPAPARTGRLGRRTGPRGGRRSRRPAPRRRVRRRASPTTTSARATASTCAASGSAARRSPTPPT